MLATAFRHDVLMQASMSLLVCIANAHVCWADCNAACTAEHLRQPVKSLPTEKLLCLLGHSAAVPMHDTEWCYPDLDDDGIDDHCQHFSQGRLFCIAIARATLFLYHASMFNLWQSLVTNTIMYLWGQCKNQLGNVLAGVWPFQNNSMGAMGWGYAGCNAKPIRGNGERIRPVPFGGNLHDGSELCKF